MGQSLVAFLAQNWVIFSWKMTTQWTTQKSRKIAQSSRSVRWRASCPRSFVNRKSGRVSSMKRWRGKLISATSYSAHSSQVTFYQYFGIKSLPWVIFGTLTVTIAATRDKIKGYQNFSKNRPILIFFKTAPLSCLMWI
jgi:hypothetical protein